MPPKSRRRSWAGQHQDCIGASAVLRRLGANAGTTPWGENAFTYGVLWAEEQPPRPQQPPCPPTRA